jgi:DNA-binding response OmpR family regulator/signal transduction histidine kinase
MIIYMANVRDRIMIVENDAVVADLIGRQALQSMGYQILVVGDATSAISKAIQWAPDLVITDINLPGLSGKDLMVALSSQGMNTPMILLAQRGQEADIIQAFRLGAADYLLLPVREAEVISAVERVLTQVHERRERERLSQRLQQTNQELQMRVRELTTIFSVGKAVTSITDMGMLMDKILEGATRVTQADIGWFLMRDDPKKPYVLVSSSSLPASLGISVGMPWDDGISSLVAMSGEPLSIHGEPLKRFKIFTLGQAALIVPIKAQKQVIGLLVMMRKQATAFAQSEQHLLEALADYASISLVNAHLFRSVDERARSLLSLAESAQIGEKINNDILQAVKREFSGCVDKAASALSHLGKDPTARWRPEQRQLLATIQDQLDTLHQVSEAIAPLQFQQGPARVVRTNLNDLVRQAVRRAQAVTQHNNLTVTTELPPEAVNVGIEAVLANQVLDGLMSHAVKYSQAGGQIFIRLDKSHDQQARLSFRSVGTVIDPKEAAQLLDEAYTPDGTAAQRYGGLSVRLSLIKEILTRQSGKISVESQQGKSLSFLVSLPLSR